MSERVLAERYELGERLGSGGMSTVLLATDRRLERKVAIKLLAEHLADDAQFVTRFRREALSAARLVHPNIVQVYDFGEDNDSGRQYIVMEYVEGSSGAEILSSEGTLAVSEAVGILAQACRGLDYAHRSGVIHRDVKPGNLLRSRDGVVKLADFGIAKALSEESSITQVGSVLGTAAYLSPEQASGQGSNPRSDIYALGVVCYQFLSGRLPYEAQSITELALKQQREAPPLLNELNPDVSPELAAAVDRALELEPEARYETAEELRVALADGARGVAPATAATSVSTPRTAATTISQATGDQPATTVQRREPRPAPQRAVPDAVQAPRRKRGWVAPTIVLLIALALGAAALVYVTGSSSNGDVRLRRVVYQQVDQTATQMQQLIRQNTKSPLGRLAAAQVGGNRREIACQNRLAQPFHDARHEGQVVDRQQTHRGQLARLRHVPQIAAAIPHSAGRARTALHQRLVAVRPLRCRQINPPAMVRIGHQRHAMTAESRWHHAVEGVDPHLNAAH